MIGRHIGHYQVIDKIGAGGMATVYEAYDPRMDRHVALKVLPPQFASNDALSARLRKEIRVAAKLEHFHILRVYDCGEYEDIPYIVMRLLKHGSLANRLQTQGAMPPAEVLRLIQQIAEALHYAHSRGVIHRDLKPGNVLLDADANAYLTDFGLAQLAEDSLNLTGSAYIGTPNYSSPEQCLGHELTPAGDIYSLGIMLFEMLTGRLPFIGTTVLSVLNKHVREPLPDPRRLNPQLPGEVADIVRRAAAKSPRARYAGARALANALAQAFSKATPRPAITRPLSPTEAAGAQTVLDRGGVVVGSPTPDASMQEAAAPAHVPTVMLLTGHEGDVTSTEWSVGGARLASASNDCTVRVWDATNGRELIVLRSHTKWVNAVAWSPRSTHLASASVDRTIKVWQAVNGEVLVTLEGHTGSVWSVAWHPKGKHLASAGLDGTVRVWQLTPATLARAPSGKQVAVLTGHMGTVRAVAWSPALLAQSSDSRGGSQISDHSALLASGGNDGTVRIWQVMTQSGLLASARARHRMITLGGHTGWVRAVAWSPDGSLLASGSDDDTVRIWQVASDAAGEVTKTEEIAVLEGHAGGVNAVAWSPDGAFLASGSADRTARVWDASSGKVLAVMQGHKGWVWSVAWASKGGYLSTGSADGTVRVWKP